MKYILTAAIALLIAFSAHAQKEKRPTFGEISDEELSMKSYALDTSANAVILFDLGSVFLSDDLEATFKRHVRIKFFSGENIDEFANRTLYYEPISESITKIKGVTYNMENGKLVESKLGDEGIFKNKVDKVTSTIKFTLPNVKPGSIIEFTYQYNLGVSLLPTWQFQSTIPTLYSEYETSIPKTFTFKKDMQGFLPLTDMVSRNDGTNEKLIIRNAPAFKVEPFITTPEDYLSAVSYYITSIFVPGKFYNLDRTWPQIVKGYDNSSDFGMLIRSNGWLDKTVEPIIAGATTPEEKAKRIHDYVKANIAWNEISDKFPDHSLKKVLDDRKGSSSEINMLMIAMMRRAELDSHPVLISTRSHGVIRPFTPNAGQFNDVICLVRIGDKNKLYDGTDKTLPHNALPERCLNGQGLVIAKDAAEWVDIVSGKSRTTYVGDFKIALDGQLDGKITVTRDGLSGGEMRSKYSSLGKEGYVTGEYSSKGWQIAKSDFLNIEGIAEAPKEAHEVVIRDHAVANGDVIYVNPYVTGLEQNVFKSEARQYPVNIPTPFDHFYTVKLEVPAGYKVEEVPSNKAFVLPDNSGKFIYSTTVLGNTISFTSQLSITKNFILPENYPSLREFYAQVIAKQAEQIVLKKAQ